MFVRADFPLFPVRRKGSPLLRKNVLFSSEKKVRIAKKEGVFFSQAGGQCHLFLPVDGGRALPAHKGETAVFRKLKKKVSLILKWLERRKSRETVPFQRMEKASLPEKNERAFHKRKGDGNAIWERNILGWKKKVLMVNSSLLKRGELD